MKRGAEGNEAKCTLHAQALSLGVEVFVYFTNEVFFLMYIHWQRVRPGANCVCQYKHKQKGEQDRGKG